MIISVIAANDNMKDYGGISMIADKVRFIIYLILYRFWYINLTFLFNLSVINVSYYLFFAYCL